MATADRRKTLSALSNNALNTRENNRMSMGPQRSNKVVTGPNKENERSRMPLVTNAKLNTSRLSIAPMPMKSRQSLLPARPSLAPSLNNNAINSNNINQSRTSLSRQSLAGGNQRRRSSAGPRMGGPVVRSDPRPLKDKDFLKDNIRKLIIYLSTHLYTQPISPKLLMSPTGRDFKNIITFLFERIDENWQFAAAQLSQPVKGKKDEDSGVAPFEVEVSNYLRILGYPFPLSKNSLSAAGSPHTWPAVLAMLVWIVEMLNYQELMKKREEALENGSNDELASAVDNTDALFLDYCSRIYNRFLAGEDEYPDEEERLEHTFAVKNAAIQAEIDKLEKACAALQAEQDEYAANREKLEQLTVQVENGTSDDEKLKQLCEELIKHKQIVEKKLEEKNAELAELTELHNSLNQRQAQLKLEISLQPFTPLQLASMKHQHSMLTQSCHNLQQQREKLIQQLHTLESNIQHQRSEQIESQCAEFNHRLVQLSQQWQGKEAVDFNQLMLTVENGEDQLIHVQPDLSNTVKPLLSQFQTDLSNRLSHLHEKHSTFQAKLEVTTNDLVDCEARVQQLQQRLKRNEENYRNEKSTMTQKLSQLTDQIEELEKDVREHSQNNTVREQIDVVQQEIAELDRQAQQLLADQEDEVMKSDVQICALMNELTKHKQHVETTVEKLVEKAQTVKDSIQQM